MPFVPIKGNCQDDKQKAHALNAYLLEYIKEDKLAFYTTEF